MPAKNYEENGQLIAAPECMNSLSGEGVRLTKEVVLQRFQDLAPCNKGAKARQPQLRCARLHICAESFAESDQHNQHVFGEKGYVAGIPVSVRTSPAGLRLLHTLQHRPHEFVADALRELQVYSRL